MPLRPAFTLRRRCRLCRRGSAVSAEKGLSTLPFPCSPLTARVADVPVYLNGVGTAKARNTVTVRPQVDGRIMSINFKEGQEVEAATCWPRSIPPPTRPSSTRRSPRRRSTKSQLANAQRDLERYAQLGGNVIAQKTIDTQRALVAQLDRADQAGRCGHRQRQGLPRLHHHRRRRSTAAPASAWSTRATSCAPPTPASS